MWVQEDYYRVLLGLKPEKGRNQNGAEQEVALLCNLKKNAIWSMVNSKAKVTL